MKKKVCFHDQIDEKKLIIFAILLIYDLSALNPQGRLKSILYFTLKKDIIWYMEIRPLVSLLFDYYWFF